MSFRARGILAFLMTHEHGWKVTLKTLASDSPEGVDALRAAVNELEQLGYLIRRSQHQGGRFKADDWEICDPSGLSDPALIGYSAVRENTALDNATRRATALDYPMRTALDNPTTLRTQVEQLKEIPSATIDAHGNNEDAFGGSNTAAIASPEPCPKHTYMPHAFTRAGVCADCGAAAPIEGSAA